MNFKIEIILCQNGAKLVHCTWNGIQNYFLCFCQQTIRFLVNAFMQNQQLTTCITGMLKYQDELLTQ